MLECLNVRMFGWSQSAPLERLRGMVAKRLRAMVAQELRGQVAGAGSIVQLSIEPALCHRRWDTSHGDCVACCLEVCKIVIGVSAGGRARSCLSRSLRSCPMLGDSLRVPCSGIGVLVLFEGCLGGPTPWGGLLNLQNRLESDECLC